MRRRILDIVTQFPGLHLREVARNAGVAASHAQYHLRVLEKTGFVASESRANHLVYYPTKASPLGMLAAVGPSDRKLLDLLRQPTILRILVVLTVEGPLNLTQLARRCEVTPPTVLHHMDRIQAFGLVVHETQLWRLRDPDRVRALLLAYEPPPRYLEGFLETWQRLSP